MSKKRYSIILVALLFVFKASIVSADELDTTVIGSEGETGVQEDFNGVTEQPSSAPFEAVTVTSANTLENANEDLVIQDSSPSEVSGETPVEPEVPVSELEQKGQIEEVTEQEKQIPPYIKGNGKVIKGTPFYVPSKSGLEQVGTLSAGVILTPTKVTTNYLIVTANTTSYYIPKKALTSTTDKSNLETHIKGNFPRDIIAENEVPFTDQLGKVLGTIAKGEQVKLHMVQGGRGVIELLGKRVYVDLSNFYHKNLVNPKKNISYKEMEYYLKVFSYMYPEFTELVRIGSSVQNRTLYALKVGNGSKEILMDASLHAREHMTTNVLLEMIDQYTFHYFGSTKFSSYNVKTLLDRVSICFVPMMNPDGVTLVQSSANASSSTKKLNQGSANYKRWKANIRGVDLNRNFDGGWATKVSSKAPSYKNYKGTKAFSEPESQALRDFVAKHKFKTYISYHSSGSVLYYYHHQKSAQLSRDLTLANKFKRITGYRVMPPTGETGSGASTDWFIMNYKMPGITVEIAPAVGETVVPLKYWDSVWNKNKTIGLFSANEAYLR